jgi:hypothetical protein
MDISYDPELSRLNGLRWMLYHILSTSDEKKHTLFYRAMSRFDKTLLYKTPNRVYTAYFDPNLWIFYLEFQQILNDTTHQLNLNLHLDYSNNKFSLSMNSLIMNNLDSELYPLIPNRDGTV